jgi:Fe-S cluster assembly protein SufD
VSAFSIDVAARLPGPEPLRQRRIAAAERLSALPWPSADDQVWRYSRIAELDAERFPPVAAGAGSPPVRAADLRPEALPYVPAGRCGLIITVDGALVHQTLDPRLEVAGEGTGAAPVERRGGDAGTDGNGQWSPLASEDVFAVANEAFARDTVIVEAPRGATFEHPLVVVHRVVADGVSVFPRLIVRAAPGSRLQVVEILVGDGAALVCPVVHLLAARDAQLGYLAVHDLGPRAWQIANQLAEADTQSTITSSVAAFGGDYARLRTDCNLVGRGAAANLLSLYFGDGRQMLDFRTFQDHRAPDTTSELLFKGAVDEESHSVYTGLIRVRPTARGTSAFQTNRNLKLSERAWAESVPDLEIENNDVHCSHASTVGPIDLDQRFYLESRGVPPEVAQRLILSGFFEEVIARLPLVDVAPDLRRRVAAKLRHGAEVVTVA